jgi:hypothetical protein
MRPQCLHLARAIDRGSGGVLPGARDPRLLLQAVDLALRFLLMQKSRRST